MRCTAQAIGHSKSMTAVCPSGLKEGVSTHWAMALRGLDSPRPAQGSIGATLLRRFRRGDLQDWGRTRWAVGRGIRVDHAVNAVLKGVACSHCGVAAPAREGFAWYIR